MRKNGDFVGGRRVKKPRICDFPLQSAAIQRPVAVREQHCLPLAKRRGPDRDFRGDLQEIKKKIRIFLCNRAFCGASRECCTEKFDVTQHGYFEGIKITNTPRECCSPTDLSRLSPRELDFISFLIFYMEGHFSPAA